MSDFNRFWNGYKEYVADFEYTGNIVKVDIDTLNGCQYSNFRCIKMLLKREGVSTNLIHIAMLMQK